MVSSYNDLSPQNKQIQLGTDIMESNNSFEDISKIDVEKEIEKGTRDQQIVNSLNRNSSVKKHLRGNLPKELHLRFKIKLVYEIFNSLSKKFGNQISEDKKKNVLNEYQVLCNLEQKSNQTKLLLILNNYLQNIPREREILINNLFTSGHQLRNNQNRYGNPIAMIDIINEFSIFKERTLTNRIMGRNILSIDQGLIEFIILKTICYSLTLGQKIKLNDFKNYLSTFIEKIFHPITKNDIDNIVEPIKFDIKMKELEKELNDIQINEIQRRLKKIMGPTLEERFAALRNNDGNKGIKKTQRIKDKSGIQRKNLKKKKKLNSKTTKGKSKTTKGKSKTTKGKSKTTKGKSKTTKGKNKTTKVKSKTTKGKNKTTKVKSKTTKGKNKTTKVIKPTRSDN